ncbi:hypothetical protein EXN66_Car021738 [Channa argus]|uniref:Uncharacterized protein n=1 Tax=Channa argus TaxID=215402 RepID=A0A6G1QU85_CHAAH|nr:hypothetical protein EXN66_Car021738 [Channa argus]
MFLLCDDRVISSYSLCELKHNHVGNRCSKLTNCVHMEPFKVTWTFECVDTAHLGNCGSQNHEGLKESAADTSVSDSREHIQTSVSDGSGPFRQREDINIMQVVVMLRLNIQIQPIF